MNICINDVMYKIVKDVGNTVDSINFSEKVTEYFAEYDYLVGDWAYGSLRLKGFYNSKNSQVKEYNDIEKVNEYLNKYCAYGCKYFILEKINIET